VVGKLCGVALKDHIYVEELLTSEAEIVQNMFMCMMLNIITHVWKWKDMIYPSFQNTGRKWRKGNYG
jgi:hypothetical protein